MAKQNEQNAKSAANDIQNLFDPQGYQNVFKTWANMNERLTQVVVEAGNRSTDIASDSAKEAFANIREVALVRDEPAEYGKAYSDFLQKQTDLFVRTARSFADVSQKAGKETTEVAARSGEEASEKATQNAEGAADKAGSAAKKAAA